MRYEIVAHTPGKFKSEYGSVIYAIDDFINGDLQKYKYICIYDKKLNEWLAYNCTKEGIKEMYTKY